MAEADGDELPEFRGTAGDEQCPWHTDLQTLDGGAPVSIYTVSRELGHTSPAMVQRVYAHLGTIRHRSEVVEYRVEQHRKALGGRLEALERAATGGESPL
jgi:hypothetical protein